MPSRPRSLGAASRQKSHTRCGRLTGPARSRLESSAMRSVGSSVAAGPRLAHRHPAAAPGGRRGATVRGLARAARCAAPPCAGARHRRPGRVPPRRLCQPAQPLRCGAQEQARAIGERLRGQGIARPRSIEPVVPLARDRAAARPRRGEGAAGAQLVLRRPRERGAQTAALEDFLNSGTGAAPVVLVTHQVNITALTGQGASSGGSGRRPAVRGRGLGARPDRAATNAR